MNTSFPVDFDSPKNTYYEILYVSRQPSLSSFGAKPLSSPPVSALQILTCPFVSRQPSLSSFGAKLLSSPPVSALQISTQISSQHLNANIAYNYYRFPGSSLGHRYRCRYKPHIHRLFSTSTL